MAKTLSSTIVEKEMGYTRGEFLNQFRYFARQFAEGISYTITGNSITILSPDTNLLISFCEQSERSIGALNIPRLLVQFTFNNYSKVQQKQFFKKFDLSFQRGGG